MTEYKDWIELFISDDEYEEFDPAEAWTKEAGFLYPDLDEEGNDIHLIN